MRWRDEASRRSPSNTVLYPIVDEVSVNTGIGSFRMGLPTTRKALRWLRARSHVWFPPAGASYKGNAIHEEWTAGSARCALARATVTHAIVTIRTGPGSGIFTLYDDQPSLLIISRVHDFVFIERNVEMCVFRFFLIGALALNLFAVVHA